MYDGVLRLPGPLQSSFDASIGVSAGHMAREEADVLPLLEARLCTKQQRDMVWRTLQAMPLRLLERVLPWLAGAHLTLHDLNSMPGTVACTQICRDASEGCISRRPLLLRLKFLQGALSRRSWAARLVHHL